MGRCRTAALTRYPVGMLGWLGLALALVGTALALGLFGALSHEERPSGTVAILSVTALTELIGAFLLVGSMVQ